MNPEKAKNLLYKYRHIDDDLCIEDVNAALELGIEAIDRHLARENLTWSSMLLPLPSETED